MKFVAPSADLSPLSTHRLLNLVILLDIMMPGLDGYQVCERLKADEKMRDIPVIFMSAIHEPLDKVRAFAVGGVDYLTKPIQNEELLVRIEHQLTLRRLQDQLRSQSSQLNSQLNNLSVVV